VTTRRQEKKKIRKRKKEGRKNQIARKKRGHSLDSRE
jgi:hypothetical protein